MWDLGLRLWDLGLRVWDLGFRVWDLVLRVCDLGFWVEDLGFRSSGVLLAAAPVPCRLVRPKPCQIPGAWN